MSQFNLYRAKYPTIFICRVSKSNSIIMFKRALEFRQIKQRGNEYIFKVFSQTVEPSDFNQIAVGNCQFISALSSLCSIPLNYKLVIFPDKKCLIKCVYFGIISFTFLFYDERVDEVVNEIIRVNERMNSSSARIKRISMSFGAFLRKELFKLNMFALRLQMQEKLLTQLLT